MQLSRCLAAALLLLAGGVNAEPQALPKAGLWQLSLTMEGAPGASGAGSVRQGQVCLGAQALAVGPEQALLDAASSQAGSGRAPPRCLAQDVRRTGTQSSWQAQCEGPMGKMTGSGTGQLAEDSAELQQAFELRLPLMKMNLKQTVVARRTGSC